MVYYATITCDKENYIKLYKEICKATFEKRLANHKKSFNVQTYKTIPNFLLNIGPLKQSSLSQKYHGKSEGDTIPKIPFPEDVTYA